MLPGLYSLAIGTSRIKNTCTSKLDEG